jgi:hypothetical protein
MNLFDICFENRIAGMENFIPQMEKEYEKRLLDQYKSEASSIKKLTIVNSLSFDHSYPKEVLILIFGYLGKDNHRIAKTIVKNHVTRPNLSTQKNCKFYVEQISCNTGNFKQFLVLFRQHKPEDQQKILDILPIRDIIKLFHVPCKMKSKISKCLQNKEVKPTPKRKKSRKKKASATSSWMSRDHTYPRRHQIAEPVVKIKKTKLQIFDETISEHLRIGKRNVEQMSRMSGADQFDKPVVAKSHLLAFASW